MRYKIMYGGRGGAKSWNVARTLLTMGVLYPQRILCTRELQVSILDSVHRLLSDQIAELGLESYYTINKANIIGPNGTEFMFAGLHRNTKKIKSFEGIDKVWVEEAATVTKESWDLLLPTIRKEGSEIWATFNPELETDDTYVRFVLNTPDNCMLIPVSWRDNPYFGDVLNDERLTKLKQDPRGYLHVWEGHPIAALEGAIFEEQITEASKDNRFTRVPHDRKKVVNTYWDLGRDTTAIWFVQEGEGQTFNIIDYEEDKGKDFPSYLSLVQNKGYIYGMHYLPHDGSRHSFDSGFSPEDRMDELAMPCELVTRTAKKFNSIENGRALFPRLYFDKEKTAIGVQALRRYKWKEGGDKPVHDIFSHGADAFLTFADAPEIQRELLLPEGYGNNETMLSEYDPLEMKEDANGNYVYSR